MNEKLVQTKASERTPEVNKVLKKIFVSISLFFLIFFMAIVYTIYIAQKNFEPIYDNRYVEKGMNYEHRIAEFKNFKEHQWKVEVNLLNYEKINRKIPIEITLSNQTNFFQNFISDENRKVVLLKISYPASIREYYEFEFLEKDFLKENQKYTLKKELELPVSGFFEFQIEVRPEKGATFYKSKKIYVE